MTAVFTGATMLGATVMGAMAMDLGDFPEPIITDGEWNGRIVIGEQAASADVAGATEIGAALPELGRVPVTVGNGQITVEGGYEFEGEELNEAFPGSSLSLDERDLEGFKDTTVRWDGEDIRFSEVLWLDEEALTAKTSAENEKYEEYGINTFLNVDREKVAYRFVFDDEVNASMLEDEELVIDFLGREIEISELTDNEMKLQTASISGVLTRGDTWEVEGKTIEIITIHGSGDGGVLIDVDGERKNVLNDGEVYEVGGLDIEVDDHVFIEDEPEFNFVSLKAGSDLTETIRTGDGLTIFGEDEDDPEWIWEWNLEDQYIDYISAELDISRFMTEAEVEYEDERPALAYGESLMLPNNYGAITFEGYMDDGSNEVSMNFRSMRLMNSTDERTESADFLVITSDSDRGPFRFGDDVRADSVYINNIYDANDESGNESWAFRLGYEDGDDRVWYGDEGEYDVDEIKIQLVRGQDDVKITPTDEEEITFEFNGDTLVFELEEGTDGFDEFVEDGLEEFGGVEYGVKLGYGVWFEDPESMIEDGRFRMQVPHEKAEPKVFVTGPDAVVHETEAGVGYQYPVKPENVMLFDTDAIDRIGDIPMLVVGGPNANTVAAELLGVQQFGEEILEMFEPNKAMIKLFEDENAILVAGYEGKDTYAASLALANFEDNKADFEGHKEVELSVPASTVTSIVGAN